MGEMGDNTLIMSLIYWYLFVYTYINLVYTKNKRQNMSLSPVSFVSFSPVFRIYLRNRRQIRDTIVSCYYVNC
jgi:hypothetical protein